MRTRNSALVAVLVMCAGAALPVVGQNSPVSASTSIRAGTDFRAGRWLEGRKVVDAAGQDIATTSDSIVDRGTGEVEYLVVKTGAVLGMGGKTVAIRFASFSWEASGERFVLSATAEQLKRFPKFSAKDWSAMMESREGTTAALADHMAFNASDPYAGSLDNARTGKVEGEVVKVDRTRTSAFGEQVTITVTSKEGNVRRVALGPSWFVNGAAVAPVRGDKVSVDTLALVRDPDKLQVGTRLRIAERDVRLRDGDGNPAWALKSVESGKNKVTAPYWRYVLASTLRGMPVDCRGQECGKVNEVIVERGSGEVAFLSIDPNQNFLGISDTKRLVPWSVCSVSMDGKVRVDASKEMLVASPETPSKLTDLSDGGRAQAAYAAYQVPAPSFEPTKPAPVAAVNTNDSWSAQGPVVAAVERNSDKQVRGKVAEVLDVNFEGGVGPAAAIKVREAKEDTLVLLGPAWYMDKQKLKAKAGDEVELEVCTTRINGTPYLIARSLNHMGNRVVLLGSGSKPAWDGR